MNTRYLQEAPPIIKEFLTYTQTVQGRSALTVDEYYLDLRTFFRYTLRERKMISLNTEFEDIDISCVDLELVRTITFSDIVSFINYCANERHNQIISRNRKGTSLKQYFKYLTDITGQIEKNPTANLKTPTKKKKLPKHLTLEQSLQLLQAVDGNNKERDYCILILFLNCGMRLSELVGINLGDINDERILRLRGKGNKERTIYLNDACIKAIESYKKVRPVDGVKDKNALFISRNKNRMSAKTVQAMVYGYLKKIGLDGQGYSVHKLRHTAATLMYQHGGVDIRALQDILGHESVATTQIYTHLSNEQVKEALNSNPLSDLNQ
ncbi:MAG: tyrosine-type recombinase/integrase [Clostridia bacterium]|nr:tyrosine-type recombinase/integrase [Clostridia bacterium]